MIAVLKNEIEQKLGISIQRRGDCQLLSDAVLTELGESINYNTIRRFFGVDKSSVIEPSKNTLNILSKFLGYASYNQFSKQVIQFGANQYQDNWYFVLNSQSTSEVINYLIYRRMKDVFFVDVFIRTIRELLLMRRFTDVDLIFRIKDLKLNKFSYSESIYVGNSIGILLRDVTLEDEDYSLLLKNKLFIRHVLSIFVDYSSLNKGYGVFVTRAEQGKEFLSKNDALFFECLSALRHYLLFGKCKTKISINFSKLVAHPILIGRLAAIKILQCEEDEKKADVLNDLRAIFEAEKVRRIDYFYEVNIVALIMSDFNLIAALNKIQDAPHIRQHYQISHHQLSMILRFLNAISTSDRKKQTYIQQEIKKELWVTSYYDIFDLFYHIGLYHSSLNAAKKNAIMRRYMSISEKMVYPIFNKNYLISYFD
jgi:hypothetical protein